MSVCLISLGSNLGDRQGNLDAAIALLATHPRIKILAQSAWRATSPVGGPLGQGDYLNGAVKLETSLAPRELLGCLQQIESQGGRRRDERWGARTIDLDLLLYEQLVLNTPELAVPHPRMAWRRFVLEPAADVAGSMIHPTIHWTVARLLQHLNESAPYVAVTGPIAAGKTRLAERLVRKRGTGPLCEQKGGLSPFSVLILEEPDWSHLDAFYSDPPAHAWETEMEFLDERTRLLSPEKMLGGEGEERLGQCFPTQSVGTRVSDRCVSTQSVGARGTRGFFVSDFWFDQSAAFARAWLPAERLREYLEKYERMRQTVVRPRLVVLLDAPADELSARVRQRGRACERRLSVEALSRIRHEVLKEVERPDVGPVLRTSGDDAEAVFAETLAAVQGME
jgi:2-amino-4-hydroxy-6-hydroxymethyldihydropteridine diphosphokinase